MNDINKDMRRALKEPEINWLKCKECGNLYDLSLLQACGFLGDNGLCPRCRIKRIRCNKNVLR